MRKIHRQRRPESRTNIQITAGGRGLLLATAFILFACMIIPAFGVLSSLLALELGTLLIGFSFRPRIDVEARIPDQAFAGENATIQYRLCNRSRSRAFHMHVELSHLPNTIKAVGPAPFVTCLRPGESITVTSEIRPSRRGSYALGIPLCRSTFPFRLFSFNACGDTPVALTVLPAFYPLHLSSDFTHIHADAFRPTYSFYQGTCPEYAGNRPFVSGDSPRKIDSRAWARLTVPVIKEYHNDIEHRTALLLDGGDAPDLTPDTMEAAVSLCASIAFSLDDHFLIDLLAIGPSITDLRDVPRHHRVTQIHHDLACAPEQLASLEADVLGARDFQQLSNLIIICLNARPSLHDLCTEAALAGCRCTMVVVDDPPDGQAERDSTWAGPVYHVSARGIHTREVTRL